MSVYVDNFVSTLNVEPDIDVYPDCQGEVINSRCFRAYAGKT